MNRIMILVVLGIVSTLLIGCNEKPEQTAVSDSSVTSGGSDTPVTAMTDPPVEDPAATAEGTPAKTTADKLPPEEVAADDTSARLVGEWFALFGTHDNGVITEPWEASHRFTFSPDGTGRLVKFDGDQPTESLFVKWLVADNELLINFIASDAVNFGMTQIAPLGIARDEETGLLPLGVARDEETGLLSGDAPEAGIGKQEFRRCILKAEIGENYLALADQHHRLMIYGRDLPGGGGEMPDLSGDWVGHVDMHDNFAAKFDINDDGSVVLNYDHDGGKFVGKFYKGYLVGKVDYGLKYSLAALFLDEEWELDGVYVAPPFQEMVERYNFNRYSE